MCAALVALFVLKRGQPHLNGAAKKGSEVAEAEEVLDEAASNKRRALLLYGTQTGTAERFSKQVRPKPVAEQACCKILQ